MSRLAVLLVLAGAVVGDVASAQSEDGGFAPSYQRRRAEHHRRHDAPKRRPTPLAPSPSVAAGTFQRPYPYHLDYYKQRFGGSYAPYFGNLYGPPNVVLGTPYGAYGYYPGYPIAEPAYPPEGAAPWVGPSFACPHCGEQIFFGSPRNEAAPPQ